MKGAKKIPAHGRHRISRPIWIVAPIVLFPLASNHGLIAFFLITPVPPKGAKIIVELTG